MTAHDSHSEPIDVEVLDAKGKKVPMGNSSRWFHPLSAVCMIVLDFGGVIGDLQGLSLWLLMPLVIAVIFCISSYVIARIQRHFEGDTWKMVWTKGMIAGVLCAIPLPVFGTAVGSWLLIQSGIQANLKDVIKKFTPPSS